RNVRRKNQTTSAMPMLFVHSHAQAPNDAPFDSLPLAATVVLHSTQSAMNRFVSPPLAALRLDAQTRRLPSGLNIGNASKSSSYVIRSRPPPSTPTMYRSKLRPRGFS